MKRTRAIEPFFYLHPNEALIHPSIVKHAATRTIQSATFDKEDGKYHYWKTGNTFASGGLLSTLKYNYYPHYQENRSKRKWKKTNIRGSTCAQGKLVDKQIGEYTIAGGKGRPKRVTSMASALLGYWEAMGHIPQVAQLPVEITRWNRMTQADYITRAPDGRLWLWEVKTGFPVGGFRKQGEFKGEFKGVSCTKYNIWQLQLHFTREGLKKAGVDISESRIIQVHSDKSKKMTIIVHEPKSWIADATQ